ncbi:MAG: chorismate lyase [Halothiobacillaceae bacterium]|nr:chorismate lyase [Halothiobacillaceae bacterium]
MGGHDVRRAWLLSPGSLTKRLRRVCPGSVHVDVLSEGWVRAEAKVAHALAVPLGVWVWRREVILRCNELPYVHAVSFAGRVGVRALDLQRLGGRPLGEVVFSRGSRCEKRGVVRRFGVHPAGAPWRRWSVFNVRGHRVLLYEDFLPSLPPRRD